MLIQHLCIRPGGTEVLMDDITYHFKPNERGDHVAEVKKKDHQKRFLAITEGYELYDPEAPKLLDEFAKLADKDEKEAAEKGEDPNAPLTPLV